MVESIWGGRVPWRNATEHTRFVKNCEEAKVRELEWENEMKENGTEFIICHHGNVERKETRPKGRSTRWCEKRVPKKEMLLKARVEAVEDELNREAGKNLKGWG